MAFKNVKSRKEQLDEAEKKATGAKKKMAAKKKTAAKKEPTYVFDKKTGRYVQR